MHWRKIQSKELLVNGLLRKKNMEIQLNVPTTGAVIFRDEDGNVYLDHVFVGPDPVHIDTCLTYSVGFYALFDLKD